MSKVPNITDDVKSLSTALADLQDEKRRWRAEKETSDEALRRKRERYHRGLNNIIQMKNKVSKAREEMEAERGKSEAAVAQMGSAVDANDLLKKEITRVEVEIEERRERWRNDSDRHTEAMERLIEEMHNKRESTKKENVESLKQTIEKDFTERGYEAVCEKVRAFENNESVVQLDNTVAALDLIDALNEGIELLGKEERVVEEITARAQRNSRSVANSDSLAVV